MERLFIENNLIYRAVRKEEREQLKLQILIPHYKEDTSLVRRQLDSIATQQGVDVAKDVGVIICNDGSDVLLPIDDFEKAYPFAIQYCVREHSGMSAIRSFLLKLATADYVMCCDSDDVFSNMLGLYKVDLQLLFRCYMMPLELKQRDR